MKFKTSDDARPRSEAVPTRSRALRLVAFLLLSLTILAGCADGIDENTTAAIGDTVTTISYFFTTSGEDPEATTAEENVTTTEEEIPPLTPEALEDCRGVVISKVYGNGNNLDAPVEHSFIELYNTTDKEIKLDGLALYYTASVEEPFVTFPFENTSINAKSYLLIRCNPAYKSSVKTYDHTCEVFAVDKYDLTWDVTIDNKTPCLLLAPDRLRLAPSADAEYRNDSAILSYFVASTEKKLDTGYVDGFSKNKIAVRTELSTDSGYYLVNLTKANSAKLSQILPASSTGTIRLIGSKLTEVTFSQPAGFYTKEFGLTLTAPTGYDVYYTTDGTDPLTSASTTKYTAPLAMTDTSQSGVGPTTKSISGTVTATLPGAHVVRAYAKKGEDVTAVYTNTYFVTSLISSYNTLVASLSTSTDEFKKFYNNFFRDENKKDPRELAMMELFDENGERRGYSNIELAVTGHGSSYQPMRSMRFYIKKANNEGGGLESDLFYDVFQGEARNDLDQAIGDYSRLLFRSSGNDYFLYMRDGFMQRASAGVTIDRLAFRQVLIFLNGEFFGVYNLRERYSGEYFESHHGIDKENIAVIESDSEKKKTDPTSDYVLSSGIEGDEKDFNDLYHYIKDTKLATQEQYDYVTTKLDIDSVIDLFIVHSYFNATDWPVNNVKVWRNRNPEDPSGYDTKWHFSLLDLDWGLGYWKSGEGGTTTTEDKNRLSWCDDKASVLSIIMHYLLKHPEFKERFLTRFCEMIGTAYQPDLLSPLFEEMVADKKAVLQLQIDRWAGRQTGTSWELFNDHVERGRNYINSRNDYIYEFLCTYFSVTQEYLDGLYVKPKTVALLPADYSEWDKIRSYNT